MIVFVPVISPQTSVFVFPSYSFPPTQVGAGTWCATRFHKCNFYQERCLYLSCVSILLLVFVFVLCVRILLHLRLSFSLSSICVSIIFVPSEGRHLACNLISDLLVTLTKSHLCCLCYPTLVLPHTCVAKTILGWTALVPFLFCVSETSDSQAGWYVPVLTFNHHQTNTHKCSFTHTLCKKLSVFESRWPP